MSLLSFNIDKDKMNWHINVYSFKFSAFIFAIIRFVTPSKCFPKHVKTVIGQLMMRYLGYMKVCY